MSVQRQGNYLSQERLEVFDFRSLESSICYDFDTGFGSIQAGQQPLVVTGLTISVTGTAGNPVSNLILNTAGAVILHPLATESGTIFRVPGTQAAEQLSATNPVVIGSFSSGSPNYIGLDLIRESDTTTADLTKFLDANTKKEVSLTVPKARNLVYRIVLSQQPFSTSSNLLPIAIVVTDGSNNVSSITDARQMFFRLGVGGDIPNALAPYTWPDASRTENPITYAPPTSTLDPFVGGDKGITNMKSLLAAIQSSIWELRGGKSWYSPNNRDNVQLLYTSSVLSSGPGTGDNFGFSGSTLVWKGLKVAFENSAVSYNNIADNASTGVTILDQQCLYVDIQRDSVATLVPGVAYLTALGTPVIPGTRFVIAWREGSDVFTRNRAYQVNRVIPVASAINLGIVQLHQASLTPLVPIVFSDGDKDTASGIVGLNSSKQASITSISGDALTVIGTGSGAGLVAQGSSGGPGIQATGGAGGIGEPGVSAQGGGTGSGAVGVLSFGGSGGIGVNAHGGAGASGVLGVGGSSGIGLEGLGGSGAVGVSGTGGSGNTTGVVGVAGGNGDGVIGTATAVGHGVRGNASGTCQAGVLGFTSGNNIAVLGQTTGSGPAVYGETDGHGGPSFKGDSNLDLSDQPLPSVSTGVSTGVYTSKTNCRCWGVIQSNGSGSGTALTGINITSVGPITESGYNGLRVTYTTAFSGSNNYCPMVQLNNNVGNPSEIVQFVHSSTYIDIAVYDTTSHAYVDLFSVVRLFSVQIFGQ